MKLALIIFSVGFVAQFANAETELARVEKNLGAVKSIQLVKTDGPSSESKLLIRIDSAAGSLERDITQFQSSVEEMLSVVSAGNDDAVVTKKLDFGCYMIPHATPELSVNRLYRGDKANTSKMEVILTNVSCAFDTRLALASERGEQTSRILYKFILDAAK